MMTFGLCVTPDFLPSKEHTLELNYPYTRSILYKLSDVDKLLSTERPFIITLNNQCAEVRGDWSGWDNAVFQLLANLNQKNKLDKLLCLVAGNEFDIYWNDNGSVPPEFGADLARRTSRIARNYNVKVSATSVAGPRWQEYLETMADLCRNDVDYFDVHFYGQRPTGWHEGTKWFHGDLAVALNRASDLAQKPLIATEIGVKIQDAGSESEVGTWLTAAHNTMNMAGVPYKCWFAYTDEIGSAAEQGSSAFGLKTPDNRKRPAWISFMRANLGVIVPPQNNLDKWRDKVGKGLLDMMSEDGTEPAMASEWRPFDREEGTAATIEQCIGINNVTYCYNIKTGSGWRIRPD